VQRQAPTITDFELGVRGVEHQNAGAAARAVAARKRHSAERGQLDVAVVRADFDRAREGAGRRAQCGLVSAGR